jgi:hypothetical protein
LSRRVDAAVIMLMVLGGYADIAGSELRGG